MLTEDPFPDEWPEEDGEEAVFDDAHDPELMIEKAPVEELDDLNLPAP